ncbi:MAG TPA: DUF6600 domain-containing protein [Verrucomicrobiae bacterium]|nr:DUF6600 domain-containing protein [Verrucomicrobiae bacterium]
MKTPLGPSWFVAIGVSAIVFIGAFGRFDPVAPSNLPPAVPTNSIAAEKVPIVPARERPLTGDMSPGLAQVVQLAEAHVDPNVILAFIQNSGQAYAPTADQILYLSSLGMPENVISALYQRPSQQAASTPAAAPPAVPTISDAATPLQEMNTNMFTEALAPYGTWMQVPNYGTVWQPAVELANPQWKPYVNDGQWIDSDSGWYWQSAYTWGWAPFHYGGWVNAPLTGWVWAPGNTWAPAWVAWRSTSSHIGWAPLPPGVSLNVLAQLSYNGHPVPAGFDFDLTPSSYVIVRASRFLGGDLANRILTTATAHGASLIANSTVVQNYSVVNNKIINGGISRKVVAAATKQTLTPVPLEIAAGLGGPSGAPPTLLASANEAPPSLSSLSLPPLHSRLLAPGPVPFRHDFAHRFPPAFPGRFQVPRGGPPPPFPVGRPGEAEPPHPAEPIPASNSKSTK